MRPCGHTCPICEPSPDSGAYQRWVSLAWYASAAQKAVEAIPDGLLDPEAVIARDRIIAWRDRLVEARDQARYEYRTGD